jgi:uncharacterized protein (DUF58 family)
MSDARVLRTQDAAETLAGRLPPLLVEAYRVAATVAQGVHGRRRVGIGETFWQFRSYETGDTISRIDWRQSAKGGRVFVRENEWEAAQSVWLWRDGSGSMSYRSNPNLPLKRQRAELLLLALAALLMRGGEHFALLGSGQTPRGGRPALNRIAETLLNDRLPKTGVPAVEPLPRYAHSVLFGDFLAPIDEIKTMVNGFASRGVKGHLVQMLDPAEEGLPFGGRISFQGFEGESDELIPRVETVREAYGQRLQAHREGLRALARAAGWTFTTHRTDKPPQPALLALFGAIGGV